MDEFMEENIYNLDDERDNTGFDYTSERDVKEDIPEEEEMWKGEVREGAHREVSTPFALLAKCMFNPVEGFKSLYRSKQKNDLFASQCFYPLVALAAISNYLELIFGTSETSLISCSISGIVTFITFFFGYFTTLIGCRILLPREESASLDKDYGKNLIMIGFCTLAFFYILSRCIPVLAPVWGLMPIWTIYILTRGAKFLSKKGDLKTRTCVIICFLTIFVPLAWQVILGELLPSE